MRKIVLVAVMAIGLLFVGCEKEDAGLDKRLVDTKWVDTVGDCHYIYHFINARKVEHYFMKNGIKQKHYGTYNYTLEYPHLYIARPDEDGGALEFIFEDSHTMRRTEKNMWGYYDEYIKQ